MSRSPEQDFFHRQFKRKTFLRGTGFAITALVAGADIRIPTADGNFEFEPLRRDEKPDSPENAAAFPADLFADTWWYGLTSRWTEEEFIQAAKIRKNQGFNAIQLVVGVPPEVGPLHPSVKSDAGFPYDLKGNINQAYFDLAKKRIEALNDLGFTTIIYGAWGHHIDWLGKEKMKEWWDNIISNLNHTKSLYSLTGESNFMVGGAKALWPDKSSDDFLRGIPFRDTIIRFGAQNPVVKMVLEKSDESAFRKRKNDWSEVLEHVRRKTEKPIIIHTNAGEISKDAVNNPDLLSAVTTQTGHNGLDSRIWYLPMIENRYNPDIPFVDLEHPYEGITGKFYGEEQLLAYWLSTIAGARGFVYGAQGMWQIGRGDFLTHWGRQTWQEALKLTTPVLINASNQVWKEYRSKIPEARVFYEIKGGKLTAIGIKDDYERSMVFYPLGKDDDKRYQKYWLPEKAIFTEKPFGREQAVGINI